MYIYIYSCILIYLYNCLYIYLSLSLYIYTHIHAYIHGFLCLSEGNMVFLQSSIVYLYPRVSSELQMVFIEVSGLRVWDL